MLPSKRRLSTELFDETILGRSFHSPSLSIKVIKSNSSSPKKSRFAAVASKNYFKTAVSRSRARRRVYAAISNLLPFVSDGYSIIVLIKPDILKFKITELTSAVENLFEKAGIMKKRGYKVE